MTSRNPCINSTLPKECNITSYLLKGWNRDKQDICIVVDAEDDLTRGINGHEVARAAAKILDPANTLCFPSCENISPHITVPDQFKYRVLTNDELYARVPQLNPKGRRRRR
jgi:hypothetical protein